MNIIQHLRNEIRIALAVRRYQRAQDRRKLKAQRDLTADVAKRKAFQRLDREDQRALRRLAQMRGRGIQRLRQA